MSRWIFQSVHQLIEAPGVLFSNSLDLLAVVCVDGEFSHGNAEALSEQIKPIWPGVRYVISPERLTILHQALCRKILRVEFSHAYLFMSYGCAKLAVL